MSRTGAEILVDTLVAFCIDRVFGMPGDGINGVMEAIRTRQDRIRFIQVRNEENAAFAAVAHAKLSRQIGCCLATTGPGGLHLLNGLYDAKFDRAPVLAITGAPYHDVEDSFTQQDVDHTKVFMDVAAYTTRIMGARHVESTVTLACRHAVAHRGVAHVAVPVIAELPVTAAAIPLVTAISRLPIRAAKMAVREVCSATCPQPAVAAIVAASLAPRGVGDEVRDVDFHAWDTVAAIRAAWNPKP